MCVLECGFCLFIYTPSMNSEAIFESFEKWKFWGENQYKFK